MILAEKKALNLSFKIGLAIGLGGLLFYLLQEMTRAFLRQAYPAFIVIADFLGMFALIAFILWLFIPKIDVLLLNIGIILGVGYGFVYVFAHFFAPDYIGLGFLGFYQGYVSNGLNFIGILILTLFSIGVIVVFALNFGKRNQFGIFEKFIVLVWAIILGVFTQFNYYYFRNNDAFDSTLTTDLGITFLPVLIEFLFFLFAALLLILSFFVGIKKKVLDLIVLLFLNVIFLSLAIATTNVIAFDLPIAIIGNILIIIGAIMVIVCTFFTLREKYPKSLAKRVGN
ncbi:MAG: hypothetical protein K9W42_13805 [Candidatus Heimdallarchaeota archaeon]|nr:hypothetical protein [Candidatus Heimdallarchaeota archaeon]